MITVAKESKRRVNRQENERYLQMLPRIRSRAQRAFHRLPVDVRVECVQEVTVNAYCAFVALVRRGKAELAYATPLANYAIRQVMAGRRVGSEANAGDVLSAQLAKSGRIVVERLDSFDEVEGTWRAALVEDRRATPADMAIARVDVAAWLRSLSRRNRQIAQVLAMGETTGNVARQFNLSPSRVSQLRRHLEASWGQFQGDRQQDGR